MSIEQALPKVPSRPVVRSSGVRGEPVRAHLRSRMHLLVVEEKGIMRDALCRLLSDMPSVAFVSSVSIGNDALRSATTLRPDIVVLEVPGSPQAAAAMIAAFKNERAAARVIVLTWRGETEYVNAALRAGADGYLLKSDSRAELFDAFTSILGGTRYVSASASAAARLTRAAIGDSRSGRASEAPELTERERQIIRLIAAGHRTREIAQQLSLSHKTIEKHRTSLMRKLGLRNASAVAAYAIAHGFAEG